MTTASSGQQPEVLYRQKSRPAWFWWPASLFVIACIAIAYGAMLGPRVGVIVAIVGVALIAGLQAIATWGITLTCDTLTVGSSRVDAHQIVGAIALDVDQAHQLAGVNADARAVFRLRGGQPAVRINLSDPKCPYWLVSTSTPEQLVSALERLPSINTTQLR